MIFFQLILTQLRIFNRRDFRATRNQILKLFGYKLLSALAFAILTVQGFCEEVAQQSMWEKQFCRVAPSVEAKVGYFFFGSSTMSNIYNHGGVDVQLCGAYPVWRGLQIYGSVEYLTASGHALSTHEKTSIWEIPVNLGLKPVVTISPWAAWYFTVGPRYFYVHQHNSSPYVPNNKGKSGVGFFANTGFNFILWEHLLIDLFGEYSYEKTHFHTSRSGVYTQDVQVGGFTFGGGLGYSF